MPELIPYLDPPSPPIPPDESERERRKFYTSKRWRRHREQFLAKHPLCAYCLEAGRLEPSTVVHHKVERLDDPKLAWSWENYEALCRPCHSKHHANGRFWKKRSEAIMPSSSRLLMAIDFHGVIKDHHNAPGGKDRPALDDPAIPGAIAFLKAASKTFNIAIVSARFATPGRPGLYAMAAARDWLIAQGIDSEWITVEPNRSGKLYLSGLRVPAAICLDDRAVCFTGKFPDLKTLAMFRPWNVE